MISNINISLPKELHDKLECEAKRNYTSIDRYILYLITKMISYTDAKLELKKKLNSGTDLSALSILNKVPDIPPIKEDVIF